MEELARRLALSLLSRVQGGRLELAEAGRRMAFGAVDAGLRASVTIRDPRVYRDALRGSIGLGESYIEGLWSSDDLVSVLRLACRNLRPFDRARRRFAPLIGPAQRALDRVPRNTRSGAARNISAHYDLGNRLFESFLDPRMMYSCAIFERPEATLEQAQLAKLDRVCERLELGPRDHLLEIGTGWGGLAVHAASNFGCRVTTTTISREQHDFAVRRVAEHGLEDRVTVLLRDYRELEGGYDKLVSIEMIEAVGWQYYNEFFARCTNLTRPGGAMLLQAIVIADELYEAEKAARSFSNTHIFPGGCLPSMAVITKLTARRMPIVWADDITAHYPPTLAAWRDRFARAWPQLHELGYDERFRRLWDFYLTASEAGFEERRIGDVQLLLARPDRSRRAALPSGAAAEPAPA